MRKIAALAIIICMLMTGTAAKAAEMPDPSEAARQILEAITTWEQGQALDFLSDEDETLAYLNTFGGVIEQLARRMSYEVYAHKITGRGAVVDTSISAVDIGSAAGSLLAQSATYLAFQRIMGRPVDLNAYLSARAGVIIPELHTIAVLTPLHLIQGADGAWKLDLSNEGNLQLLNALCGGGILPYITALETLPERMRG